MNRMPANKENVIPIPATYPCQKDIGVRPGKRKAEASVGTQWMKENAATKRANHGSKAAGSVLGAQQPKQHTSTLGATSFSGIADIVRQDQPFASRPGVQASDVRTFADITSKTANVPHQEPHIDSSSRLEQLFSSGFSLQAEDAADHFSKAAAAAAAAAQQGQHAASELQPTALPSSSHPPMDWSIKSAVRFWSPEPFSVAEEATCASASTGCSAVRAFASCEADDMRYLQERYEAASMSWQHPETSYPPAALTALRASKGAAGLTEQRHAAWQEAFRGLYLGLRHRHCDAFYLCTPPGTHQHKQNMVFFGAAGIAGRPCLHAIVSRSTLGLRAAMQQQYQLSFSMPLAPRPKEQPQGHDKLPDDLASLQTKSTATAGREVDNSRESLLWFEGPLEVQGLFEYLFNERRKLCGEEVDVPVLLAPTAFPGACLSQTRPKVLGASDSVKGNAVQHRLEVKGRVPPWVVDRLTGVIKETHSAKFQMMVETDPLSGGFNLPSCSGAPGVRRPLSLFHTGGTVNSLEADRWRSPVGQMANLVMRDLVCSDGQFVTRLTRCSALV